MKNISAFIICNGDINNLLNDILHQTVEFNDIFIYNTHPQAITRKGFKNIAILSGPKQSFQLYLSHCLLLARNECFIFSNPGVKLFPYTFEKLIEDIWKKDFGIIEGSEYRGGVDTQLFITSKWLLVYMNALERQLSYADICLNTKLLGYNVQASKEPVYLQVA